MSSLPKTLSAKSLKWQLEVNTTDCSAAITEEVHENVPPVQFQRCEISYYGDPVLFFFLDQAVNMFICDEKMYILTWEVNGG